MSYSYSVSVFTLIGPKCSLNAHISVMIMIPLTSWVYLVPIPCVKSTSSVHSSTLSILGAAFFTRSTLPTRRQGNSSHSWLKTPWSIVFVLSAIRYTDLVQLGLKHFNPLMWHMNNHTSLSRVYLWALPIVHCLLLPEPSTSVSLPLPMLYADGRFSRVWHWVPSLRVIEF